MTYHTNALAKPEVRLLIALYAIAFSVPFLLKQPQLLVGSAVNAVLFIAAAKFSTKNLLPLAVIPSLAAVLNGVVFGPFTMFLLYFLPFIWVGNLILMGLYKYLTKVPTIARIPLAAVVKSGFLFAIANLYVSISLVPAIFLIAMGKFQLITALIGGAAAFVLIKLSDTKTAETE